MKSAILFTFSGTGNTDIVAKMLQEHLNERGYRTDIVRMEDVLKGLRGAEVEDYDLIGIGCQVIGFTTPALVDRFTRLLPPGRGKKLFVFRTAGGVAPVNYNASKPLIRRLRRKGYDVFHERLFSISSNWIARFDDDVIVRLHGAARRKTGLMADAVVRGEPRILETVAFDGACAVLDQVRMHPMHVFRPMQEDFLSLVREIPVSGYRQVTDALLLGLAKAMGGLLVTFDARMADLARRSPHLRTHLIIAAA